MEKKEVAQTALASTTSPMANIRRGDGFSGGPGRATASAV